jgi:hypothetical protein
VERSKTEGAATRAMSPTSPLRRSLRSRHLPPPTLLRSFGGLGYRPSEALAKEGHFAEEEPIFRSASSRLRLIFFLLFATTAIPALAAAGPYTDHLSPHTNIKTVAIISAIGETFMFEHVRNSSFEWTSPPETSFLEISDWGIDDLVTREAAAALSKSFSVKPATFEEADFDTWTWPTLIRNIRALPLPVDDIDAYVVILRDWRGDEIGNSVHQVAGVGMYRRDVSGAPRLGVFASCRIVIVDAHSYDIIASRPVLANGGKLPWSPVPTSAWPMTENDLTDAQKTTAQSDLTKLVDETLAPALRQMLPPR